MKKKKKELPVLGEIPWLLDIACKKSLGMEAGTSRQRRAENTMPDGQTLRLESKGNDCGPQRFPEGTVRLSQMHYLLLENIECTDFQSCFHLFCCPYNLWDSFFSLWCFSCCGFAGVPAVGASFLHLACSVDCLILCWGSRRLWRLHMVGEGEGQGDRDTDGALTVLVWAEPQRGPRRTRNARAMWDPF